MKPLSLPYLIIGVIITLFCNYAQAQSPTLQISSNPTTCNGSEGSITFSALTPNTAYLVNYDEDGVPKGPVTVTSNATGQVILPNLNKGLYTSFTFSNGATSVAFVGGVVLSDPIFIPTFNPIPPICEGDPAPTLPTTSTNGYSGSWSPGTVNNQTTATYTFTPNPGTCALPVTLTVVVNPKKVPVFPFGTGLIICNSGSVPVLTTTSTNGITGTWSPAVADPTHSAVYAFTPTTTGCVTGTTFSVTVNPIITPGFSFGTGASICTGDPVPALPNTSSNGITGSWNPAVVDPNNTGTYTFTPNAGQCSVPVTYTLTVNPTTPPQFNSFPNAAATICSGDAAPVLPATTSNGMTGTWTPAVVDNTKSGTYVFTSTSNPCAPTLTLTVTVNPIVTPTFSIGTSSSICAGDGVPALPNTSNNNITGSWSPAVVDPNNSGTYIFTPNPGQCSVPVSYAVTVNPTTPPVFNSLPNTSVTICNGDAAPVLPTTTDNGITGIWTPAVVSNTKSGTYVFKNPGNPCTPALTLTVTVNPIINPAFTFGPSQSVCINSTAPVLPGASNNGVNGTWSPTIVDNQNTGTYTFTPATGQCATTASLDYQVNPIPAVVNVRKDTTVYDGAVLPGYDFPINIPVTGINWVNNNPGIGLAASGSGTVPSFTATNMTNDPVTGVVSATPYVNGCMGATQSYKITVLPLNKDVFVPNVFSPNNDGKNDYLYVYGNYIGSFEMHIFNQWGQQMITITDQKQGWDGKFKGSPQPVGVYVYVLKGVTTDGRQINKKGSITLVR